MKKVPLDRIGGEHKIYDSLTEVFVKVRNSRFRSFDQLQWGRCFEVLKDILHLYPVYSENKNLTVANSENIVTVTGIALLLFKTAPRCCEHEVMVRF